MTLLWMLFAANGGASAATPLPTVAPTALPPTEIIVTGSRVATPPDDLAANVTVLSRADFDVEKPARLADLLRRVAGVHIDQVGGRGGTGSLYMRGADPNYTLVLVDGVRVNDPTNARGGSFDFSTFDVADVERVEVARGPYSAVYGGDALAGVVNIVTRRAPRDRTQGYLDAMGGAYDTREIVANAGGPLSTSGSRGNWNLGVSDSNEGEVVRGNHFDSQRVSGSIDTELGASTTLYATGRYAESGREGFPDDSGGYGFATIRDPEKRDADEAVEIGDRVRLAGPGREHVEYLGVGRGERLDAAGDRPRVAGAPRGERRARPGDLGTEEPGDAQPRPGGEDLAAARCMLVARFERANGDG